MKYSWLTMKYSWLMNCCRRRRGCGRGPTPCPLCLPTIAGLSLTIISPCGSSGLLSSSVRAPDCAALSPVTAGEIREKDDLSSLSLRHSRSIGWESAVPYNAPSRRLWAVPRRLAFIHRLASRDSFSQYCGCTSAVYPVHCLHWGQSSRRGCAASISLNEDPSSVLDDNSESEEPKRLGSDELKSQLADSERAKLIRKLSDANQYNRFLKRQLQSRDDDLANFKSELAVLELELQALVSLAEEVANSRVPVGSRKINGKYIQSHIVSRLEAIHEKVKEQIKGVDSLKFEEVAIFWIGMAESVQVMGSFDGWSRGEEMSPEYSGDYARFSAALKLRPGRYEIKFLVDGEWRLSPEFPTVGEGMMENNLLIVD